jgi:hypothetical protein
MAKYKDGIQILKIYCYSPIRLRQFEKFFSGLGRNEKHKEIFGLNRNKIAKEFKKIVEEKARSLLAN